MSNPSVIVTGFLHDGLGIGQAARGYTHALVAAGFDVAIHSIPVPDRPPGVGSVEDPVLATLPTATAADAADVVVTCIHPPEFARFRAGGRRLPAGRANVGVWAYEVDPAPFWWGREARRLDEIWASSPFVAEILGGVVDVPVLGIPPAVIVECTEANSVDRRAVVVLADGWSSLARKNPLGAAEAYCAVVDPHDGFELIVKTWNGAADTFELDRLREIATARPDVRLLDEFLTRSELLTLFSRAACFLSLHRAEGFGLPLFEAMSFDVPVVCTMGSGPGSLIDESMARLVAAVPASVGDSTILYDRDAKWLDPDLADGSTRLREALDDPTGSADRVAAAKAFVREQLSPAAIGARVASRIEELAARTATRRPRRPSPPEITVVAHATRPEWVQGSVRHMRQEVDSVAAELVYGVTNAAVAEAVSPDPDVQVVVAASTSPFELRRAALRVADGDLVVITEDHCRPEPGWLTAYATALRAGAGPLLAGPVENGSPESRGDWANYLMGFAAWAPPVRRQDDRAPTVANMAIVRSFLPPEALDEPGGFERKLVGDLWREGRVMLVREAVVAHVQGGSWLHHATQHFVDARTAGAFARSLGWPRHSLSPVVLVEEAKGWLAEVSRAVGPKPALHHRHREAAWPLRLIAVGRVLGLTVGSWLGEGKAASRLS